MSIIAFIILALIIYNHLGYPVLLKVAAHIRGGNNSINTVLPCAHTSRLPSIHIVVPAFNEGHCIQQKIDSMGWLDYPDHRLAITIYCDGCNDDTVRKAIQSQGRFYNRELDIRVVNIERNGGKVSIINRAITECKEDLIVFSDSSSILDQDVLWRSAQYFMNDSSIAVVTGDYSLIQSEIENKESDKSSDKTSGEENYWKYQNKIRDLESKLGSVMGVTGAFYAIRRDCCEKLELDTINDDFILPMRAVAKGYKAIFDKKIGIFETESTPLTADAQRRRRISKGNAQQIFRLTTLLAPSLDFNRMLIQWMFVSGKCLRVIMPYLLISLLLISAVLSVNSLAFALLFLAQISAYLLAGIKHLANKELQVESKTDSKVKPMIKRLLESKIILLNSYICQGHLMGLIGSLDYIKEIVKQKVKQKVLGKEQNIGWKKINIEINK